MLDLYKFKQRIKERCAQTGVSQSFLCEKVGRQRTYLNNIWRGTTTPSDNDIRQFAELLSTTPAYLRGETDDPAQESKNKETPIAPAVQELIDEVYGMTDNEAAALLSLIREIKGRRS